MSPQSALINYLEWRTDGLSGILRGMKEQSQMIERLSIVMEPKRKWVNREEDLQKELDKLRIELDNNKSHQKSLEDQLLKEEKRRGRPF
jgi:cell shape-determining protein MreC